jgi:hypothetical protein
LKRKSTRLYGDEKPSQRELDAKQALKAFGDGPYSRDQIEAVQRTFGRKVKFADGSTILSTWYTPPRW